jgi:hypothetical protein
MNDYSTDLGDKGLGWLLTLLSACDEKISTYVSKLMCGYLTL